MIQYFFRILADCTELACPLFYMWAKSLWVQLHGDEINHFIVFISDIEVEGVFGKKVKRVEAVFVVAPCISVISKFFWPTNAQFINHIKC
jgi:hypothetical protein